MTIATRVLHVFARYPLLGLLIPVIIYFQIAANGRMLTIDNLQAMALDAAVILIVAVPGALLLIAGYLDLSVGSTLALGAVVSAMIMVEMDAPPLVAVIGSVLAGAAVGALNGILCRLLNLSPFIVTLGTLTAVRGLVILLSPTPLSGFPDGFQWLGSGRILGLQVPVVIAIIVAVVAALFLALTPAGKHVYAIGVNPEAALLSGVAVRRVPVILYVLSGAAAGLVGAIQAARLDSAPAGSLGSQFELTVLTAVLLGGVAFTGGRGSVLGVIFGVAFLGFMQNGLTQLNVASGWQGLLSGLALVIAAAISIIKLRPPQSTPPADEAEPAAEVSTVGQR